MDERRPNAQVHAVGEDPDVEATTQARSAEEVMAMSRDLYRRKNKDYGDS